MEPILILLYLAVVLLMFLFMEFVAWFLHRFVMHGFLWVLHEDHHKPTKGRFEKNDVFAVFFSLIAFILILRGLLLGFNIYFWMGVGVTLYGLGYFLFHDVIYHRRIKIRFRPKNRYLKRIINAHSNHHQYSTPKQGVAFAFLYSSKKYAL